MMQTSERTKKMKENFMSLREKGLSFEKIASRFDLSSATIYGNLQAIAHENGVSRASLLYFPHKKHNVSNYHTISQELSSVDIEEVRTLFSNTIENCTKLISAIDNILKEEEIEK